MPAGFVVKNDFGSVQIDDTYSNLSLISKGTLSWTKYSYQNSRSGATNWTATVVVSNGIEPLIAFRTPDQILLQSRVKSGTNYTFTIYAMNTPYGTNTPPSCDYYIFDRCELTSSTGAQLVIKDSSDKIVFHDASKPLRVNDFRTGMLLNGTSPTPKETITYDATRVFAYIPTAVGTYIGFVPGTPTWLVFLRGRTGYFTSPNVFNHDTWQMNVAEAGGGSGPTVLNQQFSFMLVDVTNY